MFMHAHRLCNGFLQRHKNNFKNVRGQKCTILYNIRLSVLRLMFHAVYDVESHRHYFGFQILLNAIYLHTSVLYIFNLL